MADETSLPVWLGDTIKLIIPVLAIVGASYTAVQFWRARRWRAGDLANTLVSQLEKDDELAFACHILDWGVGPLVVPQRYRPLLEQIPDDKKNPTPTERGAVIQQDRELIGRAVRVGLEFDVEKEPAGLIYRYCFDKLFAHLANVHRLVVTEQLELEDLSGLKYWLKRIAVYEYPPKGVAKNAVFQPFLRHEPFGYQGVIELGKWLEVPGWETPEMLRDQSTLICRINCDPAAYVSVLSARRLHEAKIQIKPDRADPLASSSSIAPTPRPGIP